MNINNDLGDKSNSIPLQGLGVKPAERLNSVSEYYFSKKLKEVAEMNAKGMNVISLGVGSPDLPPSKETIDALSKSAAESDAMGKSESRQGCN